MSLIPVMSWYDTETGCTFKSSLAPNPDNLKQPWYKSQLHVPIFDLKFKLLSDKATLPTRSNPTDAGLDLYASEDVLIERAPWDLDGSNSIAEGHRVLVSTDIAVEIPPGLALFIWDRSGLSAKHGLHRVAGVCDSSYRGELKVALINLSNKAYQIKQGERIAQAIIQPVILANPIVANDLNDTTRGVAGFGSTGR